MPDGKFYTFGIPDELIVSPGVAIGRSKCTNSITTFTTDRSLTLNQPNPLEFAAELDVVLRAARDMLVEKNLAYGDSALNPVRVFSRSDVIEQLKVRIDDKLSRLARGDQAGEDVEIDLLGYLVLLQVAKRRAVRRGSPS